MNAPRRACSSLTLSEYVKSIGPSSARAPPRATARRQARLRGQALQVAGIGDAQFLLHGPAHVAQHLLAPGPGVGLTGADAPAKGALARVDLGAQPIKAAGWSGALPGRWA